MLKNKLIDRIVSSLRGCWKSMILADLSYKLLAFIVLTPLFSLLFRGLLALGGSSVLSDVDIALFFAGPFGWFCAIVLGAVWLGIIALEQASLLAILAANTLGKQLGTFDSLLFAARHAPSVLRITGRLIAWSLLVLAPFLVFAAWTYFWMLGEFDINYYLKERPLEFKLSVGVGIVLAIALASVLLRLHSGWFLALPLLLFDRISPKSALSESTRVIARRRPRVLRWIIAWLVVIFALNAVATAVIGGVGQLVIPSGVGSIALLAARVGLMLLLLIMTSIAINVFGTIGFASILFHAYRELNPIAANAIHQTSLSVANGASLNWTLTRKRAIVWSGIGVLVAFVIGYTAINSLHMEDHVQVMAHRGASKVAPENTLAAIRQAISAGADWVEIDVQETVDGEVVVIHDSDFMKLAKKNLKIWDATMDDLREIDIGSWFDAKFADERIPTLAEVLELCQKKLGVIIELKYYGHDQQLEQRVAEIVERFNMADQVMIMSLKPEGVKKMKALRPEWKCGVLMSVSVGNIQRIDADFLAINAKFANQRTVNRLHQAGKRVFVWTVNDAATMSMMMNRGVDGILTDRPELAREVLMYRSEMSSSERLLTEIAGLFGAAQDLGEP